MMFDDRQLERERAWTERWSAEGKKDGLRHKQALWVKLHWGHRQGQRQLTTGLHRVGGNRENKKKNATKKKKRWPYATVAQINNSPRKVHGKKC